MKLRSKKKRKKEKKRKKKDPDDVFGIDDKTVAVLVQ